MRYRHESKKGMVLTALALAVCVGFLQAHPRDRYEEKFDKTEPLARDGRVYLSNLAGDIEIRSWDKEEVKIEALKISESRSEERAKENADLVTIDVSRTDGVLRIETKYPRQMKFWGDDSMNVSVEYKLWIPAKASAEIKSVSGNVDLSAIGGSAKAGSVSGEITLRKASSGADLNSVSGNIDVEDVTGNVDLKTVSGNVIVSGVRGSVEAESVSGGVELDGVTGASVVDAKTISGDVEYRGKIEARGSYRLKSHSGDVRMTIPADSAFSFEAETFSGDVDLDFQIEVSGKISPREIRGVVNKGGADIRLTSFSGSIDLKKS